MKRFLTLLLITLMIVLVACGNTDTDDTVTIDNTDDVITDTSTSSDNDNTSDSISPVTYTVTGATEASVASNFNFFCDDGDGIYQQFYEVGVLADSQQLGLTLQSDVSGTVALIGSDNDGANPGDANYIEYRSAEFVNYQLGTGELIIESFPSASGESFIATLTAELTDEDGNIVNIEATFNDTVGFSAFEDCPVTDE